MSDSKEHVYGILGFPLSHSFSPAYFTRRFQLNGLHNHTYETFEIESHEDIPTLKTLQPGLKGFNVTIPHKTHILPYLDDIAQEAKIIGAVNVVKVEEGKWIGHNTDYLGFLESLKPLLNENIQYKACILGTGGSSLAIEYALELLKIPFKKVSRSPVSDIISYHELEGLDYNKNLVFINTTPVGMFPDVNNCPDIPYSKLSSKHILFDLIYNPEKTLFLKRGAEQGAIIINGLEMLHIQAEKSWEIWNSQPF